MEERLREILRGIQDDNGITDKILQEILAQHTRELDELIDRITELTRKIRRGEVDEYNDNELELDIIEIASLIYYSSRQLATLGGQSDLAKAKKTEIYNKALITVTGTVNEKKAKADRYAKDYKIMEDVLKRAYDQLKIQVEKADNVYSALKRVYSKRITELEVFRKELKGRRFGND